MAEIATGNRQDALDIIQDAMWKLVEKYSTRGPDEWGPLFHSILQSRIRDWYRRESIRNRFRVWFGRTESNEDPDPMENLADEATPGPGEVLQNEQGIAELDRLIRALPLRQQQAFMLRVFEGMDVAQTAKAMKCSTGSVKTHYSRAVHTLRDKLGDYWP